MAGNAHNSLAARLPTLTTPILRGFLVDRDLEITEITLRESPLPVPLGGVQAIVGTTGHERENNYHKVVTPGKALQFPGGVAARPQKLFNVHIIFNLGAV